MLDALGKHVKRIEQVRQMHSEFVELSKTFKNGHGHSCDHVTFSSFCVCDSLP